MSVTVNQNAFTIGLTGRRGRPGASGKYVLLQQTNSSGSLVQAKPAEGASATGATLFGMTASYALASGSLSLEIAGFNDGDPRVVRWPGDVDPVGPGSYEVGQFLLFAFHPSGRFELVAPARQGGQAMVPCTATGTNYLALTPATGFSVAGGAVSQLFSFRAPATNTGAVIAEVAGLNSGDPRQVRLPGGVDQVPAGLIEAGSIAVVAFLASGLFELVLPAVTQAAGEPSPYQTIQALRTADNAAAARAIARDALILS